MGTSKLDIVQCLLRHKPDVETRDERDDTPLHTAIRTGNLEIVLVSVFHIVPELNFVFTFGPFWFKL